MKATIDNILAQPLTHRLHHEHKLASLSFLLGVTALFVNVKFPCRRLTGIEQLKVSTTPEGVVLQVPQFDQDAHFLHCVPLCRHPDLLNVLERFTTGGGAHQFSTDVTNFINEFPDLGV